jgi:6-phosphogluconate dehydrogenase
MNNSKADIGVIGLGVMGESLALNMESHGFVVAVHNRCADKIDDFINGGAQGKDIVGCADIVDFINTIKQPRKVMLMFPEVMLGKIDASTTRNPLTP